MDKNDLSDVRLGIGLMLVNKEKKVFVGKRTDSPKRQGTFSSYEAWQMPQGGIDEDESPQIALFREMKEEIGCNKGEIIAESKEWYTYDLPADLQARLWRGRFRAQTQKWFLVRFLGEDRDINIDTIHPEFIDWKWVNFNELSDLIVPFKRDVYLSVMKEFDWYFN
jgi:putative (di)nucleoside polyphosphate hydrolase